MRVKFSREKTITPDFNGNTALPEGEQLRFKLKPMELGDFGDALEGVRRIGAQGGQKPEEMSHDAQKEFLLLAARIVPKYVESVGAALLTDDEGAGPVSIEDMVKIAPFMSLTGELFWSLFLYSQPTELDLKN